LGTNGGGGKLKGALFALALVMAVPMIGCDPATSEATEPAPKPEQGTPVSSEPKEEPKKEEAAPQLQAGDNPNRVYQLRDLDKVKLTANGHTIDAWVMDTNSKRAEGMMFLKPNEVKDTQGMIFVFNGEQDAQHAFWMKDTYTPLDIIYIDKDKKVVNVGKGEALNEDSVFPTGAYQYVLELKQGVGKKLGIKPGTPIRLPGTLKADE
jgi:uncharacterized membrane protein (UPF0127 family)